MNETYKVTLGATTFDGVELNGNTYVFNGDVSDAVNAAAGTTVVVKTAAGAPVETIVNMTVGSVRVMDGKTNVAMFGMSEQDRKQVELESRVSFLEMMGGM